MQGESLEFCVVDPLRANLELCAVFRNNMGGVGDILLAVCCYPADNSGGSVIEAAEDDPRKLALNNLLPVVDSCDVIKY